MKIGILTHPLRTNYGGLLQAFALQNVLKKMGHEPYTINLKMKKVNLFIKIISFIKRFILRYFFKKDIHLRGWMTSSEEFFISKNTSHFVFENITVSKALRSNKVSDWLNNNKINACVVGSDQVWRPKYVQCIYNYYLDFIDCKQPIKRIVYAASFGVDDWEYTQKQTKKCRSLIKRFDEVSVRENSGILLCEKYFNIKATHVLDPTFLLDKQVYIDLVNKDNITTSKGDLMVYVLDNNEDKKKIVKSIATKMNLTPFAVMPKSDFSEVGKNGINECVFPKVTEWIRGFIDAKFIVTDSFHGTVFSIIFNKPFVAVANKGRGLTRFSSILNLLGLSDRLIFSYDDLKDNLIFNSINYELVNSLLNIEKKKSLAYICKSLISR